MIYTTWKRIPNTKFTTQSIFVLGRTGTEENERRYESDVVEKYTS